MGADSTRGGRRRRIQEVSRRGRVRLVAGQAGYASAQDGYFDANRQRCFGFLQVAGARLPNSNQCGSTQLYERKASVGRASAFAGNFCLVFLLSRSRAQTRRCCCSPDSEAFLITIPILPVGMRMAVRPCAFKLRRYRLKIFFDRFRKLLKLSGVHSLERPIRIDGIVARSSNSAGLGSLRGF